MASRINKAYEDAVASGLLPGASLFAGDQNGNLIYSNSFGRASLKEGRSDPFEPSTVCAIASMSKLMTSVAALQCVEDGKLSLDGDIRPLLPEMGKYGIITGFDDAANAAVLSPPLPASTPITLRMLLSHTSGHEYDLVNPLLAKWRASRGEQPYVGATVADKSTLPLVFEPGTGFAYGPGQDWAGKAVEVAAGAGSLDDFMRERIWTPLGIEDDISFYPRAKPGMRERMADISLLTETENGGVPQAVDAAGFDMLFGATECLGGGGLFATAKAYYTFLSAVLRRDSKLLTAASYDELFRPQLDEKIEQMLNDYLVQSPAHEQTFGLNIPLSLRKNWSFAGMIVKEGQEGRFKKGTVFWGGATSPVWFIDHDAGICGTAVCQIIPSMHPAVASLHEEFQRGVFEMAPNH